MPDGTPGRLRPVHPHQDHDLQVELARWNRKRLALQTPAADPFAALDAEYAMRRVEVQFIEDTRRAQRARKPRRRTPARSWLGSRR
jgi:hypothetical protein